MFVDLKKNAFQSAEHPWQSTLHWLAFDGMTSNYLYSISQFNVLLVDKFIEEF